MLSLVMRADASTNFAKGETLGILPFCFCGMGDDQRIIYERNGLMVELL